MKGPCPTGKVRHTEAAAVAIARRARRRDGTRSMVAYRCALCSRWHTGHLDLAEKRRSQKGRARRG